MCYAMNALVVAHYVFNFLFLEITSDHSINKRAEYKKGTMMTRCQQIMADTIDQVDLYIKHVVDIHSEELCGDKTEGGESDSGRGSCCGIIDLPGADLTHEEFTEEFMHKHVPPSIVRRDSRLLYRYNSDYSLDSIDSLDLYIPSSARKAAIPKPTVPKPLPEKKECLVCTGTISMDTDLVTLGCCSQSLCADCMSTMITVKVNDGQTYMPCPNPDCNKAFQREVIVKHIRDDDIRNKYERFRLNAEGDKGKKTCPNCCLITEQDLPAFDPKRKNQLTPSEYNITCSECSFQWCFNCHSPWHEGLSCQSYRKGDKQFTKWTKGRMVGYTPNCQQCPKCKVYIERSTGCDSMTCNRCKTNFCYKCGETFTGFPGLGDHYKHLSVFGCPYNYLPEENAKRRVIRGGYLFAKCAAVAGFPILLVGGVAVVAVGAVVVVPLVGGAVAYKVIRRRRGGY